MFGRKEARIASLEAEVKALFKAVTELMRISTLHSNNLTALMIKLKQGEPT